MTLNLVLRSALLYVATMVFAIPSFAEPDWAEVEALKAGQMKGLKFHETPQDTSDAKFLAPDGSETTMEAFKGRVTVLNFWATWCGPCRAEMPTLNALQETLGGEEFAVALLASGPRNEPEKIAKFFQLEGIDALQSHRDPRTAVSRDMGILGLPITVILDPNGKEIARLRGDAHWDSHEAIAILSAIIKGYAGGET